MPDPGALTAERETSRITLTMTFPEGVDECFSVETFVEMVVDPLGGQREVWVPIHTGTSKFVYGTVDYHVEYTDDPEGALTVAPPGPRTYRALRYQRTDHPSLIVTDGVYTDPVTV